MPSSAPEGLASSCAGLDSGGLNTLSNFTITAYNTTLPNANSTGAPLILGDDLSYHGYTQYVLATYSYPYPALNQVSFSLDAGGLVANLDADSTTAVLSLSSDHEFDFIVSTEGSVMPAPIFCAVQTDNMCGGYPVLAANGRTNLFLICERTGENSFAEVVYNGTTGSTAYDVDSCYAVDLCLFSV
ncbi:hypothetical protein OE88DRAFT_1739643 [Heliocybe sulcata]|uniref:Uncharacterized protein n=1 Tax=Heliocybe sulcata TaxID=5364 RepID=A0A5C3MLJ9_9AGAM|nr:hypothetical protein OE88DRAFT_1739643 [Heliocybe sulcata]